MKGVKKGFTYKGVTVGDIVDGSMVIGIDSTDDKDITDIALLRDKETVQVDMDRGSLDESIIFGLMAYKNSDRTGWVKSGDIQTGKYKIEKYNPYESEINANKETLQKAMDEINCLKAELKRHEVKACVSEVADATDYKAKYLELRGQLDCSIEVIKQMARLL